MSVLLWAVYCLQSSPIQSLQVVKKLHIPHTPFPSILQLRLSTLLFSIPSCFYLPFLYLIPTATGLSSSVLFFLPIKSFTPPVLLELAAVLSPGFAQYLMLEPLFQYFWFLQYIRSTPPASDPAGKKAHCCISIATLQNMGERDVKEQNHSAHQNQREDYFGHGRSVREYDQGFCTAQEVPSWDQAVEHKCSRAQSVVINSLWSRWMCVTLQRDQSLKA